MARLSWSGWLTRYWDGLRACTQSPSQYYPGSMMQDNQAAYATLTIGRLNIITHKNALTSTVLIDLLKSDRWRKSVWQNQLLFSFLAQLVFFVGGSHSDKKWLKSWSRVHLHRRHVRLSVINNNSCDMMLWAASALRNGKQFVAINSHMIHGSVYWVNY